MKKVLVILFIIIAIVFIYINFRNNNNKGSVELNNKSEKQKTYSEPDKIDDANTPEFPDIYNFSSLIIDSKLKPVKLNIPDSLNWNSFRINIFVSVPSTVRRCDLFLLINNKKRDMFYRVGAGRYVFRNVKLNKVRNEIEIFYRIHNRRSKPASSIIIRE